MKRILVLTILIVSIAGFAMEGRTLYLALISGCLTLILLSVLDMGRPLTTRSSIAHSRTAPAMSIEQVRRA
jgi:hypothetical protein